MSATAAATFNPKRCSVFRVLERHYEPETASATFRYALDDLAFEEIVTFPAGSPEPSGARAEAFHGLLSLLHLVAGVSYFKAAAPRRIETDARPGPAVAALLADVYRLGLGEFAYRNDFDEPISVAFAADDSVPPAPRLTPGAGSLVPIGGGKDSAVALEIARAAGPLTLFSVGNRAPIARTAEVARQPRLIAERRISPQLLELNARGALNGHVPITAIVSLIALATAVLHGRKRVVMANERSASQASLHWRGIDVNHQWSKSYAFEQRLRAALAAEVVRGVDYFSVLRPASELAIARAFARMPAYHEAFTSCNSAFRLTGDGGGWCGDCPKCRFVFLALAPFLSPARLEAIFGVDLLEQSDQIPGFMALCGFQADKPFECVGEREESVAAFRLLCESALWSEHVVVRHARETLLSALPDDVAQPAQILELSTQHNVPEPLLASALAHLRA